MDGGGGNGDGIATVGPALPPINVARPSEAVAIPVTNDGEEMAGPRKVRPLASSRFKPTNGSTNGSANNNPEPKPLTRVREEMGDSPKSPPGTPRSPGTYDLFKTRSRKFSGPLEKLEKNSGPLGRQVSRMRSRRHRGDGGEDVEAGPCKEQLEQRAEDENGGGMKTALSANRYFQALSGPELEDVKDKENLLLPHDEKWPFLLRFPIGTFGVALGLGSQTMLWKTLAQVPEMAFLHIPLWINFYLWCLALLCFIVVFFTYMLKIHYYFEAVRREYHHPVRVNFFFAPWIAAMFLAIGVPPRITTSLHPAVWCCFMLPIFLLELKIYGQWLSGGQRRLSKVANPSTHLSVVGNFVGSTLAATVGWTEPALFFWAVGLAHYLVLFVTLYQRLPTNETLPSDLHPVFFLFVAAPSAASVAWMRIVGEFDYVSRLVFFISLFLYTSLIVRINFFRGFKFSIAWWAYTFPMTAASIASIQYCHVATSWITRGLAVALSFISSATVCTLFVSTLLHVFWWRCLFPNDLAIAITAYKPKTLHFKTSETDDGCGLYSLQHSEPLYKSMLDAYHSFLSARDEPHNGADHDHDLHRSTTV
ncbi:hypothetical protein KC19_4G212600 [Ceratodon purpureus]|uniref:Uncharacterized protein n=1 Tax=Ceratodon purpureus TaxID=3225 RepID=A0A8T0IEN9_CERPU|nr:hypothetical protein KC19_4G212600 [Ceratodon purpureus]